MTAYEGEWKSARARFVLVTPEGTLIEAEEQIDSKDVPPGVLQTASKQYAGQANLRYTRRTVVTYKVEGKISGKDRETTIYPSGKVVRYSNNAAPINDRDDDK